MKKITNITEKYNEELLINLMLTEDYIIKSFFGEEILSENKRLQRGIRRDKRYIGNSQADYQIASYLTGKSRKHFYTMNFFGTLTFLLFGFGLYGNGVVDRGRFSELQNIGKKIIQANPDLRNQFNRLNTKFDKLYFKLHNKKERLTKEEKKDFVSDTRDFMKKYRKLMRQYLKEHK